MPRPFASIARALFTIAVVSASAAPGCDAPQPSPDAARCRAKGDRVARLWDPGSRASAGERLRDAAVSVEAADTILTTLDARASDLAFAARDRCYATRAAVRITDESRRTELCLQREIERFSAALGLLVAPELARKAPRLVAALPPASICSDRVRAREEPPVPSNPNRAAHVLALRRSVVELELLAEVEAWPSIETLIERQQGHVDELDHAATTAAFAYAAGLAALHSDAPSTARGHLVALMSAAERAQNDRLLVAGGMLALAADADASESAVRASLITMMSAKLERVHDAKLWAQWTCTRAGGVTPQATRRCLGLTASQSQPGRSPGTEPEPPDTQ